MSWTLVQAVSNRGLYSASFTNNTAGNLLIACVGYVGNIVSGGTFTVNTFGDSNGNTWTKVVDTTGNEAGVIQVWVCFNAKAGANTVTWTQGTGSGSEVLTVIAEYSNTSGARALDATVVYQNVRVATSNGVLSFTAAFAGELGWYFGLRFGGGETFTPIAGWTTESVGGNQDYQVDNLNVSTGAGTGGGNWVDAFSGIAAILLTFNEVNSGNFRTLMGVGT